MLQELKYRIRDHFRFSTQERKELLICLFVMTFIFAFNDRSDSFVLVHWVLNFFQTLIFVSLALTIHVGIQKIYALSVGFRANFQMSTNGLLIGALITFVSGGSWYVILPGTVVIEHMALLRLGHFRYGINNLTSGLVSFSGPLANLVLGIIAQIIANIGLFPSFFSWFAFINLYYAVFSMLPIPKNDGLMMFFASRATYVLLFGILFGYILLYMFQIYSLLLALVIGIALWLAYYFLFEGQSS